MVCRQHRASNQTIKLAFECFILSRFISLYCIDKYSLSHCEIGREKKNNTRKRHWKANISKIIACYLYRVLWFNRLSNANSQQKCRKSLVNAVTWSKYVWQAKIRGVYAENHMLDLTREGQAIH